LVSDVPWLLSVVQSQLLASRSEEYRLLFRLPPDEVIFDAFGGGGSSDPQPPPLSLSLSLSLSATWVLT
jgi:hypothetical protein